MKGWTAPLEGRQSRGSAAPRPGSLAGLHDSRRITVGQFWTPNSLALLVWRIAGQAMQGVEREIHLLDNSAGIGRLLQFAEHGVHTVAGIDIDGAAVSALQAAAAISEITSDFLCAGMEDVDPRGFDVCLANPPFGLTIEGPDLKPYSCTGWGTYGASTSAKSHAYAVHQAIDAAPVVVAIVPTPYALQVASEVPYEMEGRLRAVVRLPAGVFLEEGTAVDTSLLVFGALIDDAPAIQIALSSLDSPVPDLRLRGCLPKNGRPKPLRVRSEDVAEPSILGEVTGDKRVRIVHRGRWIYLKTKCALMRAKVMNAVLSGPVDQLDKHRYPTRVRYIGQGRLDVEVMLAQPDPHKAFELLVARVSDAGGEPVVDTGLERYFAKRVRRHAIQKLPFGHWVNGGFAGMDSLTVTAKVKRQLDPGVWGSPVIRRGQKISAQLGADGRYSLEVGGTRAVFEEHDLIRDFELPAARAAVDGWAELHPPKSRAAGQLAAQAKSVLETSGAAAVASWDYQFEDLAEVAINGNALIAWRPGVGKSRIAIALGLLPGNRNAVLVEAHLIESLTDQLAESGIDPALWQVIRTEADARNLRKINLISYSTLRKPVVHGRGRRTFARLLRRRFSRVIADEAQLLRHLSTEQTRAVWMLSAKRRIAMSGTPKPNYVQDLLPIMQWLFGCGTALQPYGRHNAYLEARHLQSMTGAARGVDAFADDYVVTEWCSRGFEDGLEQGAKRQVPKIRNIAKLRSWLSPLMKRRHDKEPAVAKHFKSTDPQIVVPTIEWHPSHLAHYLEVADTFKQWYREAHRDAEASGKGLNHIVLLARIAAVVRACNVPQFVSESGASSFVPHYAPLTSKQIYVLDRLQQWTDEGRKSICYADSPQAVELYVRNLKSRGIEALPYHGKMQIDHRNAELRSRFMRGPSPVLVASIQTIERGHNLWCASRGIFACRSWGGSTEDQGGRRMCRPQQELDVLVEKPCLRGSIDWYQHQMSSMKQGSAYAAFDFVTPEHDGQEFLHLDRILNDFVEDLAGLAGVDAFAYRKELRNAA